MIVAVLRVNVCVPPRQGLQSITMPGLPVEAEFVAGAMDGQRKEYTPAYVSFKHGLYPDVAPVKDYLNKLWDNNSDALQSCVALCVAVYVFVCGLVYECVTCVFVCVCVCVHAWQCCPAYSLVCPLLHSQEACVRSRRCGR